MTSGHVEQTAGHVQEGGGVVHDLVERQQAEIDGHDLDDRPHPAHGGADPDPGERRFRQRGVADPLGTEFVEQALADGKAAAVAADILAHQEDPLVLVHRLADRLAHRLAVGELAHGVGSGGHGILLSE